MSERAVAPSERVLSPSGQNYRRLLKSTPVLLGALAPLLVVRNGPVSVLAAALVALTLAAVVQVMRREQRVIVTGSHLKMERPIMLARTRERADIAKAVSVRVSASSGTRANRNLLLLDRRERLILRLKSPQWSPEDMRQLVRWLGVSPEELDQAVTARQLGRRFPHAVPLSERFPFLSGVAVVAVIATLLVSASMLLD
ncbi:hypothetical protein [Phytoactinopolyspora halotolerans]|uniref:Uncharacterized protein n=1 Tax=Phytoactinopolyspora halotolerans TaxID=1981512 RepID=A0A6L9SBC3_9ACTN|nr:hypothetical protein [Phytoactinopolyspora halotolerans]NEE02566.1 hypothetical protein [Phytoactinopolyspora halotolerans]